MTINDDHKPSRSDDPLYLLGIRHLIAVGVAVVLVVAGILLLATGVVIDNVFMWTGGIGCILSGVGIGVYAGQVDTARLNLRQQDLIATRGETRAEHTGELEREISRKLTVVVEQLTRHGQRLDAIEACLGELASAITDLVGDELRQQRHRRSG